METNKLAAQKASQAITSLLLDEPFYGTAVMQLELVQDSTIATECTDGKVIKYNPEFLLGLSSAQAKNEFRHETEHNMRGHIFRREGRDQKLWNVACDYVINNDMVAEGCQLDATWLVDSRYNGMSEEQIYSILAKQSKEEQDKQVEKSKEHGEVEDAQATEGESIPEQKQQWEQITVRAAKAAKATKQAGKLPAWAEKLIGEIQSPYVDYRALTRQFLEQQAKNDFSWTRLNRNYLQAGLCIPALKSESLPPIVFYWDTSGSRWSSEQVKLAASEVMGLIEEARPEVTYVIYGDSEVTNVQIFTPGDVIKLEPKGGGGTNFTPIFDYIVKEGLEPCCFIGLTDLCGTFPPSTPDFPVLWLCDEKDATAPFGKVIEVRSAI